MRILGIDPGSETTGWGVIEGDTRRYALIEYGAVRASARAGFAARLVKIGSGIEEIIARHQPDVCAIEEAFYAANVQTALKLGQVRGVILFTAERAGIEIYEYPPRLVKSTIVGYGAAEKYQVQAMVRILLKLTRTPQPHDAADALAVAICHLHHAPAQKQMENSEIAKTLSPAQAQLAALVRSGARLSRRRMR